MKGVLLATSTVIVWALLNIINRFCVLKYDINIIVFTSFMIFATGVSLLMIRKQVTPENWKKGIKYSWLYTGMQIIRSFTMISTFLYITPTETSLLFNIEVVIAYILAYAIFKRIPYRGDYAGILVILSGFILFVSALSADIRPTVVLLVMVSATASCIRSIVVEKTTLGNPDTSIRQKCGISGFTLFYGGLSLIGFFFSLALLKHLLPEQHPNLFYRFLSHLPSLSEMVHPATIISACLTGLCINAATTVLYYATLKFSTSEIFMTIRAFQPVLTFLFELLAATAYAAMRPRLSTLDYIYGGLLVIGSLLILIVPSHGSYTHQSKDFITD